MDDGRDSISAPTLVDGPADLRCECEIQPGGAGDFVRVTARVTGGALVCQPELSRVGVAEDADGVEVEAVRGAPSFTALVVPLANVGVAKPSNVRDGRSYCIKLSLPAKDRDGHSKHILAFQDQATFDMWLQGLREDHGVAQSSARLGGMAASGTKISMRSAALMASLASNPQLQKRAQAAELQALSHAGWMAKKGGVRRNWQKRYFEHSGDFLFYREQVGGDLKGTIDLESATDVRPSTEIDHKQWEMEIVCPERTYRMECETEEQLKGWFLSLAKYSSDPEGLAAWTPHREGQAVAVQARYLLLDKATARQGPDDESLKVGEFDRGQVIACVEELTEEGSGIVRVRSSTAPKGAPSGGWLKKATSKGKELLQRVEYADSARALREQLVTVECGGEEVVCTMPVGVLMIIHERKPPPPAEEAEGEGEGEGEGAADGVEMLRVQFSKTKSGWVKMSDDAGLLLEIRQDPAIEAELERQKSLARQSVLEPEPEPEDLAVVDGERHDWTGNRTSLVLSKHDPEKEKEVLMYIEKLTGSLDLPADGAEGEGANSLFEALKDGKRLCALVNAIRPGIVKKVNTMNVAAVQMENIGHFLDASLALGLKKTDLFRTPDLWDGITVGQRPLQVTLCILRLRDLCPEPGSGVVEEEEEDEDEEESEEEEEEEEE
eukprot:COSAG06_NODE_2601_length_6597_cov_26.465651_1_plen_665_part_10